MHRILVLSLLVASCNESFNAGASKHEGLLPVDGRNPVLLINDSVYENWMGEYALLLANSGVLNLDGIIVTAGGNNKDIGANYAGWRDMVEAARTAGMRNIPELTTSTNDVLKRPSSGVIEETPFRYSSGAELIVEESKRLYLPYRPVVVVAGSPLTDVAIAYLQDNSVAERIWVVASVGNLTSSGSGADMGRPNGEMDSWASTIVASKFHYIQVSARYDSQDEFPDGQPQNLPDNAFVRWIANKQSRIWKGNPEASDQVSIAAVAIPDFVTAYMHVSLDTTADAGGGGPVLQQSDTAGRLILVDKISENAAVNRFWQMLRDLFPASPDAFADTK
jgi:hypothetical protein